MGLGIANVVLLISNQMSDTDCRTAASLQMNLVHFEAKPLKSQNLSSHSTMTGTRNQILVLIKILEQHQSPQIEWVLAFRYNRTFRFLAVSVRSTLFIKGVYICATREREEK